MVITKPITKLTIYIVTLLVRPLTNSCIFYAFFYLVGAMLKLTILYQQQVLFILLVSMWITRFIFFL